MGEGMQEAADKTAWLQSLTRSTLHHAFILSWGEAASGSAGCATDSHMPIHIQ